MCYKAPGPRCSSHAFEALQTAQNNYNEAIKQQDFDKAFALRKELNEATVNYHMTPAGQRELEDKIKQTGDADGALSESLQFGVEARKLAIQQSKQVDRGDVTESHNNGSVALATATKPLSSTDHAIMAEKVNTDLDNDYHKKMEAEKEELAKVNAIRKRAKLKPLSSLAGRNLKLDEQTSGYSSYDSKLTPQSPDLEKVGSVVDAVHNGANTATALGDTFDMTSRDGSYYSGGAEYLGLIDRNEGYDGQTEYRLTPNGELYREADSIGRAQIIKEMVNTTPLMREFHASNRDREKLMNRIMGSGYSEATARRRASALATWDRKVNSKGTFVSDMSAASSSAKLKSISAAEKSKAERDQKVRLLKTETAVKDYGTCNSCFMRLPATGVCGSCD